MARKSRRNKSTEVNISQDTEKNKNLLDTAAYVRLSVENGGNETDETLVVQQMLVEKYIEEHQGKDVVDEFVYDEKGELGYTWFDANDLPPFTPYEVEGVENHHQFDLGDGYIVELIHLPGHTPGQSGYLDHQTGCFFIGDVTSAFGSEAWDVYPEFCTINALRDALQDFMPRLEEVSGVFPGHGTIDLHPKTLKYILDTANRVIYHPEWYDTKVDFFGTPMYAKFIYQQGSDLKYTKSAVIKEEDPEEREF